MTKTKKKPQWRILISIVVVILFVFYSLFKNSLPQSQQLSKKEAIAKVKTLPQITDYLKKVPNGLVVVNGEEDNAYLVQVYEFKDGHTATFNWYKVDKTTGEIEKEF